MAAQPNSAVIMDAATVLMDRWSLDRGAALALLVDITEETGVAADALAGLVVEAEAARAARRRLRLI